MSEDVIFISLFVNFMLLANDARITENKNIESVVGDRGTRLRFVFCYCTRPNYFSVSHFIMFLSVLIQ